MFVEHIFVRWDKSSPYALCEKHQNEFKTQMKPNTIERISSTQIWKDLHTVIEFDSP